MNDLVPTDCSPAVDRRPPHAAESDPSPGLLVRIARRIVHARLRRLIQGTITVIEGQRRRSSVSLPSFQRSRRRLLFSRPTVISTSHGAGRWVREKVMPVGDWHCDDLTALVRIFALNRLLVDGMERGVASLSAPLLKVAHRLRRNTKTGSRQNIAAHYDLSNEFLYDQFILRRIA